jgi:hydrogenase maturation protease
MDEAEKDTLMETPNILVLGIGNLLNTDEGVGVHAIRRLQEQLGEVDGVALEDGGTLGLNLLPLVEEATHLLILDAVNANQPPGTVVELEKDEIPLYGGFKLSQHQLTFTEVLGLALIRDKLPAHLHLIGVQPASLAIGVDLSDVVMAALSDVTARSLDVLAGWGVSAVANP